MSQRKEITKALTFSIEQHVNPKKDSRIYTAREVTFDYMTGNSVRVDFMKFQPLNNSASGIEKGDFYCYEIKSSVEDFHSKNGHNFIGDYNYYVMPREVFEKVKSEIPWGVGVFVSSLKERNGVLDLEQIKNAKRRDRSKAITEMLLMMFRSNMRDCHKAGEKSETSEPVKLSFYTSTKLLHTLLCSYINAKNNYMEGKDASSYMLAKGKLEGFCAAYEYIISEAENVVFIFNKEGTCVLQMKKDFNTTELIE